MKNKVVAQLKTALAKIIEKTVSTRVKQVKETPDATEVNIGQTNLHATYTI
jgi:hypothetical protein